MIAREDIICPYPGLRTFTEEESIFFKGRDEHIRKASALLEHRKFLMITGASGEGKSSIVYAGMIPYARGGFIKSKYTNWAVVDFRPERSPLSNFSNGLGNAFTDIDENVIRTNLSKGFSSLVNLYKNSPLYVDTDSEEWNEGDEKERKLLKRRAANLLVIVDQFEEFFTNSENYVNGVPSDESALVVSTLLETARIAARDDLPIYIAFTMRSDFIGQCAAFRGLPEFIGYSQFFVPRLKRVDLKRVIQEPAGLSGVVIRERLVERLLYDLEDGEDQLPILQHALNRIWGLAVEREEDLDLLHYAMAGGLAVQDLAEEDRKKYSLWFANLDPKMKESFGNPGLKNVLDAHANQLFFQASKLDARAPHILETSLKCLTAVDEDRAVRNRMTLKEITKVLNEPDIGQKDVDDTLRIFRLEGNTFLKPYVDPDTEEFETLEDDSVLDITHESLIRNWEMLRGWAHEENRDHEVLTELTTQMNHWINNGKSSSFLLSSGSLNYFEEWYSRVNPNKYWIWRYIKGTPGADLQMADDLLKNIKEFIRRSINKNFVPRLFARYGMLNVIAAIGTTLLVLSAIVLIITSRSVQNDKIVETVKENGLNLVKAQQVNVDPEKAFLVSLLRTDPDRYFEFLNSIKDPYEKLYQIDLVLSEFISRDVTINVEYPRQLLGQGIVILDSLVSSDIEPQEMNRVMELLLELQTKATAFTWYSSNPAYKFEFDQLAGLGYNLLGKLFENPEYFNKTDVGSWKILNELGHVVSSGIVNDDNLDSLLSFISVFKNPSVAAYKFYPNDSIENNNIYAVISQLHALNGDEDYVYQAFDSLFLEDAAAIPARFFDSFMAAEIFVAILQGGGKNEYKKFIDFISVRTGLEKVELYDYMFNYLISSEVSVIQRASAPSRFLGNVKTLANMKEQDLLTYIELYEEVIVEATQEKDVMGQFDLAQFYKFSGLLMDKYWAIHGMEPDKEWLYRRFDQSMKIFNGIKAEIPERREYRIKLYWDERVVRNFTLSYSEVYAYPDYLQEDMDRHWTRFYSDAFFRYLFDRGLAESFYNEIGTFPINLWIQNSNWSRSTDQWSYMYAFDEDIPAKVRIAQYVDLLDFEQRNFNSAPVLAKLAAAYYLRWSGDDLAAKEILETMDLVDFAEEYDGRTTFELYGSYLLDIIYELDTIPSLFFEVDNNNYITAGKSVLMFYGLSPIAENSDNVAFFDHLNGSYELFTEYLENQFDLYGATSLEYAVIPGLNKLNSTEMLNYIDKIIDDAEELNLGRNFKLAAVRRLVASQAADGRYYEAYENIAGSSVNARIVLYKYILDARFSQNASSEERDKWRRYDRRMRDANFVTEKM